MCSLSYLRAFACARPREHRGHHEHGEQDVIDIHTITQRSALDIAAQHPLSKIPDAVIEVSQRRIVLVRDHHLEERRRGGSLIGDAVKKVDDAALIADEEAFELGDVLVEHGGREGNAIREVTVEAALPDARSLRDRAERRTCPLSPEDLASSGDKGAPILGPRARSAIGLGLIRHVRQLSYRSRSAGARRLGAARPSRSRRRTEQGAEMAENEPLLFENADAWEAWLVEKYATSSGVELAIAKANSGASSVTHEEALEVAICYGWIDGVRNRIDQSWYSQSFMPRREGSRWSRLNRDRAEALIAAGRMRPAGQREIDRAKAAGNWESAYAPQSTMQVPPEFEAALAENPRASDFFDTLSGRNRYAVLFRITTAKQSETRAKRAATMIEMLERGETIYPQ